jgi:hypothetical protein
VKTNLDVSTEIRVYCVMDGSSVQR